MPDYIRLPAGHGSVFLKSWLHGWYRQFYVRTDVSRSWQEVLAELRPQGLLPSGVIDCVNWQARAEMASSSTTRPGADRIRSTDLEMLAHGLARPSRHGGFGDPLPASFVVFCVNGPHKSAGRHHIVTYRLTPLGNAATTVEIWDNSFTDW